MQANLWSHRRALCALGSLAAALALSSSIHAGAPDAPDLLRIAAWLASDHDEAGAPLTATARRRLIDQAASLEHRPPRGVDLDVEHALSVEAIGHLQKGLRQIWASSLISHVPPIQSSGRTYARGW